MCSVHHPGVRRWGYFLLDPHPPSDQCGHSREAELIGDLYLRLYRHLFLYHLYLYIDIESHIDIYIYMYVCMYVYVCKEIYFKEWVHRLLMAGNSSFCRAGQRLGTQAGADTAILKQNLFFFGKLQFLRPSLDWMRHTHISRAISLKSTDGWCQLHLRTTSTAESRLVFDWTDGTLAKLTQETTHTPSRPFLLLPP